MLTIRFLIRNKKRTFITICSVTLASILFMCIGLFFSSIRDYMISDVIKNNGSYHVSLKSDNIPKSHVKKVVSSSGKFYITYDDIRKTYDYTDEICNGNCKEIVYNEPLLSLYGVSKNENVLDTFISLIFIILTILSVGVMIIIYNSFSISVMERRRQFSLLKALGMTKRKIRNMVIFESVIILLIGLLLGFVISVNLMFIVLRVINDLLSLLFTSDLKLSIYPLFVLVPFIFVIVVVLLSAFLPAILASKIPIIDSIRSNNDYKFKKEPKLFKKISITKRLAFYNYKRCRKKYRPIILCIFISIIIYTTFSMYLSYGIKSMNSFNNLPEYDAEVILENSDDLVKKKLKLYAKANSDKYNLFESCLETVSVAPDSYLDRKYKNNNLYVVSGDDDYVINRVKEVYNEGDKLVKLDKLYLKDSIKLIINDREEGFITRDKVPFGISNYLTRDNVVLVTKNIKNYCKNTSLNLFMNGSKDLEESLNKFSKDNNISDISYVDVRKATLLTNNIIVAIKIILYGITVLVLLIGVSSIINTIWASTNLRIQEFATLKSVGLRQCKLREMLFYESLYIVIKGFILALPFVFFINYILCESLNRILTIEIIYPFKELIFSFIILLLLVYLTMLFTHRRFNGGNLVSMITNDNI
ncbi:MAG: ABC transporter permease [Bacilli bacterium]|nr:ABC transporter permease [Bacilli bacterium]